MPSVIAGLMASTARGAARQRQDDSASRVKPHGWRHGALWACGSTPWSDTAVRMPDTASMCDGVDPSGGYLICRMVQVLITDTMRRTKPA
jgi:hypothetical protein